MNEIGNVSQEKQHCNGLTQSLIDTFVYAMQTNSEERTILVKCLREEAAEQVNSAISITLRKIAKKVETLELAKNTGGAKK